jgi:predicted transcriptional regulator
LIKLSIQYETGEMGLRAVLKDYQEHALRVLWESKDGHNSRQIWVEVNKRISPETISRASIINFLESMRENGVLNGVEKTGKGGHHWIYTPAMNEAEYKQHIAKTLIESLMKEFPEETSKALTIV